MTWAEDCEALVGDCVGVFGGTFTLSRTVVGAFDAVSGAREKDDYSQAVTLIEYRRDQLLTSEYGSEAVVYRGQLSDLTGSMGPEPRLAEGMYVTDSGGVRRRVVKVHAEGNRKGFALVCVMDRSPATA